VAAETLRATVKIPVIGMEPALKPAALLRQEGRILVLATPVTLKLPKFRRLMEQYGEGTIPVPCPGLMEFVERGEWDGEELRNHLKGLLSPFKDESVDAVVLGCTHYIFLRQMIRSLFPPKTAVLDGNIGTVRQLKRRLQEEGLLQNRESGGSVALETSGDPNIIIPRMELLLHLPLDQYDVPNAGMA
jgi:glutamate racemase